MVSGALVETRQGGWQVDLGRAEDSVARLGTAILISLALPALLAGCATKPKLPPGVHASVEVGPPLKSDAWKAVATAADRDRLARLGLAWQEALEDAQKTNP